MPIPPVMLTANYRERFESTDTQNIVTVIGGQLDIYIIDPNGIARFCEQLPAPVAPLTSTSKMILTKGCTLEFRPGAGASFWINR